SAQLTVQIPSQYGSKPGFIDQAKLVVEPHGAVVEQSLYLTYSDHGQYAGGNQIEIVHRFQLPANSVVNDLWLWIGDSVMQARILDTWKARSIYDSIVSKKRDPAFLTKNGEQYELHIYPLKPGSFRKIKLNFITPTRWRGIDGVAELPLKMLKQNNAARKPLEVLFRQKEDVWGWPILTEAPQELSFKPAIDTGGYMYKSCTIGDISSFTTLSLGYSTKFVNGFYTKLATVKNDQSYFLFGFNPGSFFKLPVDTAPKRVLVALDLSGTQSKNFATLLPQVKQFMRAVLKESDSMKVVAAGAGVIRMLEPAWRIGATDTINGMIDRFESSAWGRQTAQMAKPVVLYADANAALCWQFPGIQDLATTKNYGDLMSALNDYRSADVIAAYSHGYESPIGQESLPAYTAKIDSFFQRGGRFLSYFDFNRVGREKIGTHYIPGLTTTRRSDGSTTLYRNPGGNVGILFPESFVHYGFDYLQYTPDQNVKVEVQDKDGKPVVISKKIGNGLLIVSGIWSFKDDGAMRAQLGVPLIGLNAVSQSQLLLPLLASVRSEFTARPYDKVFVLSNADSLTQMLSSETWADQYIGGFGTSAPKFSTVNLLDGALYVPPSITVDGQQFYGSGYLLKTLGSRTSGAHFETHLVDWTTINSIASAYSYPMTDYLAVMATADNQTASVDYLNEVDAHSSDPNKTRFFICSAPARQSVHFVVRAKFVGIADEARWDLTLPVRADTLVSESVLRSIVGIERLKEKFRLAPKDTAGIVSCAVNYRLLCDYTALLALEPNDTIHFMRNPFDESRITIREMVEESMNDSLTLCSYPNPFNNQTAVVVTLAQRSTIDIGVFNVLGQLVRHLASNEVAEGKRTFYWNGNDDGGRTVGSGTYFIRMIAKEATGGRMMMRVQRVLFLK
ncbi:MAG: VIT domain-containing protein, partial [Acidobacteriota bacterium]